MTRTIPFVSVLPLCMMLGCPPSTITDTEADTGTEADTDTDTDADADTDTDADTDVVDDPPEATIVSPENKEGIYYDGFDDTEQLWFVDVTFEGMGIDLEDGTLTGEDLVWTTDQITVQDEVLGTGQTPTVRLFGDDCFGMDHTLTLTVTDSAGNEASESIVVTVFTIC